MASCANRLLPLLALALATIAAFLVAIRREYASLASLWTSCAPQPLGRLPAPLCFAIHFFQAAHASPRTRLEQAVIVSFLAGLATITAVEGARARRAEARDKTAQTTTTTTTTPPPPPPRLSRTIAANLAVPWLLYNVALGALAWQGIIIPALLRERWRQQPLRIGRAGEADAADGHSLAIPLSIALGLLLPAAAMLLHPSAPILILLFLLFPVWISLTHRLHYPLAPVLRQRAIFALPILVSALAHVALLVSLFTSPANRTSPTHSAILLLELDHAAIFLAVLYWILLEAGVHGVLATVAATVLLGPGAGVCVGWLSRCDESTTATTVTAKTTPGRREHGKATRCFFGGLPG